MSLTNEYLEYCKDARSVKDLSALTFQFLKSNPGNLTLFEHRPGPNPLKIIESNNTISLEEWYGHFETLDENEINLFTAAKIYNYYFSSLNFYSDIIYIFAVGFKKTTTDEILSVWQYLIQLQENTRQIVTKEAETKYANLISQLMHDIQSLIDSNDSKNKDILKRIDYQKKLNKDLLFFIRDFDLFKTEIQLKNFVKDSLNLIGVESASIETEFEKEEQSIDIDVELFSESFNAIVNNARQAIENDLSKVKISVFSEPSQSPFLQQDWLVLQVKDFGGGIAEEFEPFISKPFFTTHKHDGHTGFGLTNAKKILKAHNGFLDITTGSGTIIKIYLPQKNDEKE